MGSCVGAPALGRGVAILLVVVEVHLQVCEGAVHFPDEARTALDLFSNYESDSFRANGFYKKFDFLTLAEFMEVKENRASSFIDRFFAEYENALELVHRSFLSDEAKERFLVLFNDRLKAIES